MDISLYLTGLGSFALYFGVALVALALFLGIYMAITPHDEFAQIREGNTAAAVSLIGAVVGFTLPLASAVSHSVSIIDLGLWALVALIIQILVFLVLMRLIKDLPRKIEARDQAAAATVAGFSIAVGILNAASMTY